MSHWIFVFLAVLSAPREWRDSPRDVYLNGRLDRSVQTLVSSSPRMVAVVCGDEVLILDPANSTVSRGSLASFERTPDHLRATSSSLLSAVPAGHVAQPDSSTLLATLDGMSVLVASHQSKAGPMTVDELWETVPVWRAIANHYEPDPAVIERLRSISEPVELKVVLATWCGDSRQYVPRLLKAVERAANPNVTVALVGIDSEFESPMEVIAGVNVTNVPTVIARRRGVELGRFVETPAGETIEGDIADLAEGIQRPHPNRIERGAMMASGVYLHRDPRRRTQATERFELYERKGGGVIVHSSIAQATGQTVDVWASRDGEGTARFVETTHRDGTTTRTRFRRDGALLHATSRGSDGGIVQQTVLCDSLVTPATATLPWRGNDATVYVVPEMGVGAVRTATQQLTMKGDLPERVRHADGSERVLVSFEQF